MVGSRGQANAALYRAKLLLAGWEAALDAGQAAAGAIDDAYLGAVQAALTEAYGWFLLAVSDREEGDYRQLPRSTDDLPEPPRGRVRPPELAEFAQLERHGWLGDLLADHRSAPTSSAAPTGDLLGSDHQRPGYAIAAAWAAKLGATMARMDDALNEC